MVACRRFRHGVRHLLRILRFSDRAAPVPNSKDVLAAELAPADAKLHRLEIDASPWGGGGVLFENDRPTRYFTCVWRQSDFGDRDVHVSSSASQTYFEVLVLVLAIELWGRTLCPTVVLGDNLPALQEALTLKGRGLQGELAQALSVLIVSRSLTITVGHLPTEANTAADALSRLAEPLGKRNPFANNPGVQRDFPVRVPALWAWIR